MQNNYKVLSNFWKDAMIPCYFDVVRNHGFHEETGIVWRGDLSETGGSV
jgi:hypothetical protein